MLGAAAGGPWTLSPRLGLDGRPRPGYTPRPPPAATTDGTDPTSRLTAPPLWWTVLLLAVGALLLLLVLRWLWRRIPRYRVQVETPPEAAPRGAVLGATDLGELRAGARTALQVLDEIADPTDAVVRCWLALEQAALQAKADRRPSDSPSEFAATVLAATSADPPAVRRLLGLYHRARFSPHPVGIEEVRAARTCVTDLSRSWRAYEDALRGTVPEHR